MASDLSVAQRVGDQAGEHDTFEVEPNGKFEKMIIRLLCEPISQRLPVSVRPNTISLITHAIAWSTAACAISSPLLPRPARSVALVAAGFGMLGSMIGDCLDGMHARRTNQCSKLGEMMDHWLDAIIVPLVTLGITIALEMPPWAIVLVNVTATMIYQAQLVLYHHTGKFIHPDTTNGVEAQFGVSIGYVALAGLVYFVDRHQMWLDVEIAIVAVAGTMVQMRCNWFYYLRLGKSLRYHLYFVGMTFGFGGLYLAGALNMYEFALCLVFTSFRISGSYVLFTLLRRPFSGMDFGIIAWLLVIGGAHYLLPPTLAAGGFDVQTLLPYAACLYMIMRNALDFVRQYERLRPGASASPA